MEKDELDSKEFGRRLRKIIREKGIEQAEIARAAGLERSSMTAYIYGRSKPSLPVLYAIAKTVGVSVDYLLGFKDYPYISDDDIDVQEAKILFRQMQDIPDEEKQLVKDLIQALRRKHGKQTFVPDEEE